MDNPDKNDESIKDVIKSFSLIVDDSIKRQEASDKKNRRQEYTAIIAGIATILVTAGVSLSVYSMQKSTQRTFQVAKHLMAEANKEDEIRSEMNSAIVKIRNIFENTRVLCVDGKYTGNKKSFVSEKNDHFFNFIDAGLAADGIYSEKVFAEISDFYSYMSDLHHKNVCSESFPTDYEIRQRHILINRELLQEIKDKISLAQTIFEENT